MVIPVFSYLMLYEIFKIHKLKKAHLWSMGFIEQKKTQCHLEKCEGFPVMGS